jgi:predicted chitinase
MKITKSVLTDMGVSSENAEKYLAPLNEAMEAHRIDTPLRIAHFLAQIVHESAHMKYSSENLNYSASGLRKVFGKYFPTTALANAYARQPRKIASRVYANRMGNGDELSGDGWTYRGRGLMQLTGKNNYRAFSEWLGQDVVSQPDRVANEFAAHSAVYYWTANGLNRYADRDDLTTITKRINGGLNGYKDRLYLLGKAKKALREMEPVEEVPAAPVYKADFILNLQKLINEYYEGPSIDEDGIWGNQTRGALEKLVG